MRILVYSRSFYPRLGGLEQVAFLLARELTRRGHAVTVATDVLAEPGGDRDLPFDVIRGSPLSRLVSLGRGFDILFSNGQSLLAVLVARLASVPFVIGHQGYQAACLSGLGWHGGIRCGYRLATCAQLTLRQEGFFRMFRQLARHMVARASINAAEAHVAASACVAATIRARNTFVVHNSADTTVFFPVSRTEPRRHLLFVGRLVGEKGVDVLVHAYSRYRREGGLLDLDIVGSGPDEQPLRSLVRLLGLEASVFFRGPLRDEPLADAMRSAVAVLVPSVWDEAFGIVAAEALACGTLALVSNAGGLPEVVDGLGTTVPQGDERAWAAALHRVAEDSEWRQSREHMIPAVAKRFTEARMADGYLRVFEHVLHGRAIPG